MKPKMHLDVVLVAGFKNVDERSDICGYIKKPLCDMTGIVSHNYFRDNILKVLPGRLLLSADTIHIYGKNLKLEPIEDVISRSLAIAHVNRSIILRMWEIDVNGYSELVYDERIRAKYRAA